MKKRVAAVLVLFVMVYGGGNPVGVIRERLPHIRTIWRRRLRQCLLRYAVLGWTGYIWTDRIDLVGPAVERGARRP